MSRFSDKAGNLIFNSFVLEDIGGGKIRQRDLKVNLIVMSHETAREIMRYDFDRTIFKHAMVKTEPDTCYGARVAYDDSLRLGEMLVAEAKGDL